MTTEDRAGVALLCCSALCAEVEALRRVHWPGLPLLVRSSVLHMEPDRLGQRLGADIEKSSKRRGGIVLVYGDCCAAMGDLESQPGLNRTPRHNCCEILLGASEYRRREHEGEFFLLPEWARRWRTVVTKALGLNDRIAKDLMQDMHTRLVYLDTGVAPVPCAQLCACAEYCGLPVEMHEAPREPLRRSIQAALDEVLP